MLLSKVKKGEVFRYKPNGPVWVREEYDRSTRKYLVTKWEDACHTSLKSGTTEVLVGFTF